MVDPTARVLTVLEILQARGRVTGPELARRLEVSTRTVQRYVARLQDLGIPVESKRGVGGMYMLRAGYRMPPLVFTDDEALALALGLRALRYLGLGAFAPAEQGAQAKLERVLPEPVRERVGEVLSTLELEPSPWAVSADMQKVVDLAACVRERRPARLRYRSYDGSETEREVEPYGVLHYAGRWYLVGHCRLRKAPRSFRLDRVVRVDAVEGSFEVPTEMDPRAYLYASLPFAPAPHVAEVRLALPVERVRSIIPPARAVLEQDGDGTLLRCGVDDLETFATLLLSMACPLEVREPDDLRAAFGRVARRAAEVAGNVAGEMDGEESGSTGAQTAG